MISFSSEDCGKPAREVLLARGRSVSFPCGGKGRCGGCRAQVLSGWFRDENGARLEPDGDGTIPLCRAFGSPDGGILRLPPSYDAGLTFAGELPEGGPAALALDIGTTTLALAAVGKDGKPGLSVSSLNPQQIFGADVMSRISASAEGHLQELQSVLLARVRTMLLRLSERVGGPDLLRLPLSVAGNTVMLHLFRGISPVPMGTAPFTPAFLEPVSLPAEELGLPCGPVRLLPSASAFFGADIVCGAAVFGFSASTHPKLLLDVGTNGEMLLDAGVGRDNRLFGASVAAGPALEGAGISCGTGGVLGAVNRVRTDPSGALSFETVGNAPPRGVCGAGLVDWTACLLETGALDFVGRLEGGSVSLPGTGVTLTQDDVRALQLAKGAFRAGILSLLERAGMTPASFLSSGGSVLLSGGMGTRLDPVSAVRIGLLPPEFPGIVTPCGNTALRGAAAASADPRMEGVARRIAGLAEILDLESSPSFRERFVSSLRFPD